MFESSQSHDKLRGLPSAGCALDHVLDLAIGGRLKAFCLKLDVHQPPELITFGLDHHG
jgi:hypothetical protein